MQTQSQEPAKPPDLSGFASVDEWLAKHAGPIFKSRSSLDWFIRVNRAELVTAGAFIPRAGRAGSLIAVQKFSAAVIQILQRQAMERART